MTAYSFLEIVIDNKFYLADIYCEIKLYYLHSDSFLPCS